MICLLPSVLAAYLATHDLRVITCNGGEATPSYMRLHDVTTMHIGKGGFTCCSVDHDFGTGVQVRCDKSKGEVDTAVVSTVQCGFYWTSVACTRSYGERIGEPQPLTTYNRMFMCLLCAGPLLQTERTDISRALPPESQCVF